MAGRFDYFIILAEMRTGSNFLETNLNAIEGLFCHGEAFNPHFIGYPNRTQILGVTQSARDADPARLIGAIRDEPGVLGGFRFFHDHDARALEIALDDPRCAKIVLTRNPLDSYVSWKIAQATGQWKLTDVKRRKAARARFDAGEFADHVAVLQGFQVSVLNRLQRSGQTAYYLDYDDLRDIDVINGLAAWLGVPEGLSALDRSLKPQNPAPALDKVTNPQEMEKALSGLDRFNLTRTPNFEPRRGPAVPGYVACPETPVMYMPVRGGPEERVLNWMAALDSVAGGLLETKLTQKQLRQWKRRRPGHRTFTVLRHPVARAHAVFCARILNTGPGGFDKIRATLRRQYKLPIPEFGPDDSYTKADHRRAFDAFLEFLRQNLAGQTGLRVDAAWGSQAQSLTGFAEFAPPDHVIREEEMAEFLPQLAARVGHPDPPAIGPDPVTEPVSLDDIYDSDLENLVSGIYQRDYMMFGFGPWRPADNGR